jgi:hypothetical protein
MVERELYRATSLEEKDEKTRRKRQDNEGMVELRGLQ